jgi:hypothetical protein
MSLPRAIIPGRRYLITRRCSERRFLLRPGRETNNAFVYCMALAAQRSHVSIVCVGTTSNRDHAVVEALQRKQAFLDEYRSARTDHLAGRDAIFPPGAWRLCRYAGLASAELGATAPPS